MKHDAIYLFWASGASVNKSKRRACAYATEYPKSNLKIRLPQSFHYRVSTECDDHWERDSIWIWFQYYAIQSRTQSQHLTAPELAIALGNSPIPAYIKLQLSSIPVFAVFAVAWKY